MSQSLPSPFIGPLFRTQDEVMVATGWDYTDAEKRIHGVQHHMSIDFDAPRGTPIYAAADGWAIATFGEVALMDELPDKTLKQREYKGEPMWFGTGLMVQIWHGQGRYTQYCHLHSASSKIPFHKPVTNDNDNLIPAGLAVPVAQYGKEVAAYRIKAGEQIGTVGMTGCGWGRRSYEDWQAKQPYASCYPDHLHFVVAGRRAPKTRIPARWDPFGLYSTVEKYPQDRQTWNKLPSSLFLPQSSPAAK